MVHGVGHTDCQGNTDNKRYDLEMFIDKTIDLENYSYKGRFVVISAILKPAV